jgi:hypothetical protein
MTSLLQGRVGACSERFAGTFPVTNIPEADWLLTCSLWFTTGTSGGITEEPGDDNIRPYMANYAAIGLARAFEITNNSDYLNAAWQWLAWYRDHMDPVTGYVNDWHWDGGTETWVDDGTADSTDAYAGTYLVALYLAYWADPNGDIVLVDYADSIPLAMTAIESTQQSDGLTYALPTYDVKYLEDNIETLAGARAAQIMGNLAAVSATQPGLHDRARATADALAVGIGYLWNADAGNWDFAIHSNRVFAHNDWADENAQRQQVWATAWNAVVGGDQGTALMAAYVAAVPDWTTRSSSYEPMPAWAYYAVGDSVSALAGATALEATGVGNGRAYPWTCQISGMAIIGLLGFSTAMPYPLVIFPAGANLLPDPQFLADSDSNGRADVITGTYGDPTMVLHPLTSGGNYQSMDTPDGNGWAVNWDAFAVAENTYMTFSIYQRVTRLGDGGQAVLKYELYDSSGGLVTYGYDLKEAVTTDFTRWYINAWIPPGAVTMRPIIGMTSGAIDFAYPQLEVSGSPTVGPYGVPVPA